MLKNDILNVLRIRDITNRYGIKITNNMCRCPFGHTDSSPSMKIYDKTNSFYCFACHKNGDLIKMVQLLFGLNFQQAMEKINDDFQLGLSTKSSYNKQQIIRLEKEKRLKELKEQQEKIKENQIFISLCNERRLYINLMRKFKKQINKTNWEDLNLSISYLRQEVFKIDEFMYQKYGIEYKS